MYEFGPEELAAADRALRTGRLYRYQPGAREIASLEHELARRFGRDFAVLTSSGTGALICGLRALGIGPGDEVLIPAYGFVADPLAVMAVGATPIVCDIDEGLTMSVDDAVAHISPRTRCIMPVHMHGFATDMASVMDVAESHGLMVVEDACQSIGATYRGRALGAIGDVGAFSFNQLKPVSAGEGGALLAEDEEVYRRAFLAHDGSAMFGGGEFREPQPGLAFRPTEVAAAIARVQLNRLNGLIERLRAIHDGLYTQFLRVGLNHIPVHERIGAGYMHLAFSFDSEQDASRFIEVVNQARGSGFHGSSIGFELGVCAGLFAFSCIGDGHSFLDWCLVGFDPRDSLPRSADIQRRSAIVGFGLDCAREDLADIVDDIAKCL